MAMTNVQQNIVSEIQAIDLELCDIKGRLNAIIGMYANESIGSLTDADFAAYPPFKHITQVEFGNAATKLAAVNTALGEFSDANSAVSAFLKILTTVPK